MHSHKEHTVRTHENQHPPLLLPQIISTGVPPYLRIICSKTYSSHVKLQIIPNAMYNVIST
jgi:hypothetical protein